MNTRSVRRAGAIAAVLALVAAGSAFADGIVADSDALTAGSQSALDLGLVSPGSTHVVPVAITLVCSGYSHADAGQTLDIVVTGTDAPTGGAISASETSIDVPDTWPGFGAGCNSTQSAETGTSSTVTITAPTLMGSYGQYLVVYMSGTLVAQVTFSLTVDTPPTLVLPPSPVVIEGNMTGGALAAYTVSATDAEDATAPVPSCLPAPGDEVPLGDTSVTCTARDSLGISATGSFVLRVVDTTAPVLIGVPGAMSVTTSDPSGAVVTYATPTASDLVDPSPLVACMPASGARFPVGRTTVTCTATDARQNFSSADFDVQVTLATAAGPTVDWAPPVGSGIVDLRSGRTLPLKVRLTEDGQTVHEGTVGLGLTPIASCPADGSEAATLTPAGPRVAAGSLTWQQGVDRWSLLLDAAEAPGSPGTCTRADLTVDGVSAGFFVLRIVR